MSWLTDIWEVRARRDLIDATLHGPTPRPYNKGEAWQRGPSTIPEPKLADFFPIFAGNPANSGAIDSGDTFTVAIAPVSGMWLMGFWMMSAANGTQCAIGWGGDDEIGFIVPGDRDSGIRENTIWVGNLISQTTVNSSKYRPTGIFIPAGKPLKIKNIAATQFRTHVQFALATDGQLN